MYRLLQAASETDLNLSDLKDMTLTVKANNKEIEILYGKDFTNMKYTVLSGFNLDKVTKHHEVVYVDGSNDFLTKLDAKALVSFIEDKAVLMNANDIGSEKYAEIVLNAKCVVTFGYDMQKFQEHWEQNQPKAASKAKLEKKDSAVMEISEKEDKDKKKKANKKVKYPNCLLNVNEKSFIDMIRELKEQKQKQFMNVFETKRVLDELVEFGFPKDICEQYLEENASVPLDIMINEISKILEQNDEEKNK